MGSLQQRPSGLVTVTYPKSALPPTKQYQTYTVEFYHNQTAYFEKMCEEHGVKWYQIIQVPSYNAWGHQSPRWEWLAVYIHHEELSLEILC